MALQRLKDPDTVDCLYRAALKAFPYLDYDESHSLAVKYIWALRAINTPHAIEELKLLAKSDNPIISENAVRLLNRNSGDAGLS
jgi:hypothetical protein